MNLYYINKEYCNFLHSIDNKVSIIDGEKEGRPFLGLIICVNGRNYFAPLTSPKTKHRKMKDYLDFIRIDEGKLGAINLNNMILIPKSCANKIEIDNMKNVKYAKLLSLQGKWCENNKEKINKYAENLYYMVKNNIIEEEIKNRCCDFNKIEKQCFKYMEINKIQEEELEYKYE